MTDFDDSWGEARHIAFERDKVVVEHGWEQHVIIDEDRQLVYRFPRHEIAAAKLQDEVGLLANLRGAKPWPVAIPELLEYDGRRAVYNLIPGDVLDEKKLAQLNADQLETIGAELGEFLAVLHTCDKTVVVREAWKQPGSLIDYYSNRITLSDPANNWRDPAMKALENLHRLRTHDEHVVVHGDLHGLNMIIEPSGDHLAGVIDFSEVEIGDPHQDFRKIFMADDRLLLPAIDAYIQTNELTMINPGLVRQWAYVNEYANLCHFADNPSNPTFERALAHLQKWGQIS